MSRKTVYYAARLVVDFDDTGRFRTYARSLTVKASEFSQDGGWGPYVQAHVESVHRKVPELCMDSLVGVPGAMRDWSNSVTRDVASVSGESLRNFGLLARGISAIHSAVYATWVNEFYVSCRVLGRGMPGYEYLREYLVTEAPGMDCGRWEVDGLPE